MPQDGHAHQDCERAAAKRWLTKHAEQGAPHGVPFLGDDLSSNQPFCALVLPTHGNFLFPCQPDSHPKRSERLAFWQAADGMAQHEAHRRHGRVTEVATVRDINDGLLGGGTMLWRSIGSTSRSCRPKRANNSSTIVISPIIA
jgi:hypothetical protein